MKLIAAFASALAMLAVCGAADAADVPAPLSAGDVKLYSQAFDAAQKGDFDTVEARLAKVQDPALAGRLGFERLMHPRHSATFNELSTWLKDHGDEVGADRIQALAVRRKPDGVAAPKAPVFVAALAAAEKAEAAPTTVAGKTSAKTKGRRVNTAQAAREAYYSGDVRRALTLASAAGERWIAGLAAFRLSRPADAFAFFRAVADDSSEDAWLRSAAAFWAARAGGVAGIPEAPAYLQLAAQTPHTFYGMIADRQLTLKAAAVNSGLQPALNIGADPIADLIGQATLRAPVEVVEAAPALPTDARAHRAEALFQLGHKDEALSEAKIGFALAKTDKARDSWQALADAFSPAAAAKPVTFTPPPATPRVIPTLAVRQSAPITLPAPDLAPKGGFTIDKAMVYALVRQESAFNPLAQSGAGAVGLMQLMPEAAARAAGDDKLKADMTPLFDPAFNLRVGQDYFTWLMERGLATDSTGGYDVLRTVAAYNGGPGVLLKTAAQLGQDCDSLLLIESLPAQETRNYVERVVAAYWQYRKMFGADTRTLDALATGQRMADFRLDDGILASSLTYSLVGG